MDVFLFSITSQHRGFTFLFLVVPNDPDSASKPAKPVEQYVDLPESLKHLANKPSSGSKPITTTAQASKEDTGTKRDDG